MSQAAALGKMDRLDGLTAKEDLFKGVKYFVTGQLEPKVILLDNLNIQFQTFEKSFFIKYIKSFTDHDPKIHLKCNIFTFDLNVESQIYFWRETRLKTDFLWYGV